MNVERTIYPNDVGRLASESVDAKPIVMVNLLRFREQADYTGTGLDASPTTGKRAYGRYSKAVIKLLWGTGGKILWAGRVRSNVIAPSYESWDQIVLVYYPSRQAFVHMATSEPYAKIAGHRTAALADSRLFETQATRLPKVLMAASRLAVRALARVNLTL